MRAPFLHIPFKPLVLAGIMALAPAAARSGLSTVDLNTLTAANLVAALLGPGIVASNISYTGSPSAGGTFAGGAGIIGFDSGIVLSSGAVSNIIGPNNNSGATGSFGTPGDAQLDLLTGTTTQDAAVLEFDFVPNSATLEFTYVFSSEEYPEFVGSFNDGFALLVNGVNVALVPGTSIPVTINNVNSGSNAAYYIDNSAQPGPLNTQMDGLTTVLTVSVTVNPGVANHIKIAIADAGDTSVDSDVMLKANSFSAPTSTPTISPTRTRTPTFTYSPTITFTPTITPSHTITPTFTASQTFTFTPTFSHSPTVTLTPTPSPTFTVTPTFTFSPTVTATPTATPPPLILHLLPPNPNPATGGVAWIPWYISVDSDMEIEIFTVAGERVRTLKPGWRRAGYGEHAWDLMNDSGRKVASGTFIYRVRATSGRGESEQDFSKCAVAH